MKRISVLNLVLVLLLASCSSVNLKAVEDPEPTTTTSPAEVLGKAVTSQLTRPFEPQPPTNPVPRPDPEDYEPVPVPTTIEDQTRELPAIEPSPPDPKAAEVESNAAVASEPTTPTTEPQPRFVIHQNFEPFATVGGFTLYHPAKAVELIGFHESNHDGSKQMEPAETIVDNITMETRDRGNASRSAADIAVSRASEIRAPVTGTVVRAGTYTLYCQYRDDYVVIAPDEQPTWEVKILHINGVQVRKGDRVTARETVLAPGPTPLPFKSQIDELTVSPAPPHVHIEVVDPSIPDRPSGGGC